MAKVKLYRRLLKKAEREAQLYTKFLRTVLHSMAKEISKEMKIPINKIGKVQADDANVSLSVTTKKEVVQEALDAVTSNLADFKYKFVVVRMADKMGFTIMWNAAPRFGA